VKLLNAGCGTHYAKGWVNSDVWVNHETQPDVVVDPGGRYPFADNTFDGVFLGHVLEHVPWPQVPAFLREMHRIAKPDAHMLAVGPDTVRTLELWRAGSAPDWLLEAVIEHQDIDPEDPSVPFWPGASHHWNCHEDRVIAVLDHVGFQGIHSVADRLPTTTGWHDPYEKRITWPVTGWANWQFAIRFTNY
jgi:SAM-dependent methyltransferase